MVIRDICLSDVSKMMEWGKFKDIRYHHFNFPYEKDEEFEIWYKYKVNGFRIHTYGVFVDDNIIGFITFKKINPIFKRAELGVIFDINFTSKGYGTEAIKECINRIGLKKIYLYVSTFNERAYKVYLKIGFIDKGIVYRVFENQSIIDEIDGENCDFKKKNGKLYGKYKKMEIIATKPL